MPSQTVSAAGDPRKDTAENRDADCWPTNRRWRGFGPARTPGPTDAANDYGRLSGPCGGWRCQSGLSEISELMHHMFASIAGCSILQPTSL